MLRRFSVVTAAGAIRQLGATFKVERFTLDGVKNAAELARQLGSLLGVLEDVYRAVSANPATGAIVFEGRSVGSAGAELTIEHRLGKTPFWRVVGWRNSDIGHSLVEVSRDERTLVLASYASGIADIEVF
jgi:hypothetical protein